MMIFRILNDVKEGHYFLMRKKNNEEIARIANFGVIFLTSFIYYVALSILVFGIVHRFTGIVQRDTSLATNVPLIFGPFLAIYFLLIYPNLNKGRTNEDIPEDEKKRKKKLATIYIVFSALAVPIAGLIGNLLNGH